MESILDAPSARQATYQLSVGHYHRLNEAGLLRDDVELLDGYLIKKLPKSPLHTFICQWLVEALRRFIPTGFVRQEQPITQTVACAVLPGFEVSLPALFA